MTVPGGGEGTILPRLCSQPGERRPGPGAAHACSLSPARAPASRPPGLARHGVEGRRPGGSARSRVWKVWQEAEGRRYRGWPRWGPRVCAPGVESAPRRTETGRVEVSVPVPRARACPSPAAYNGVPSLGGLRGDGSVGISPLSGVSGHPCRPPPRWRQGSAWLREPRELSAAVRARPDALAMCWPWPGSLGPLPMVSCVGTTGPPTRQGAARSPGPGCSGGKVSGVWVCPPEMAEK